VCIIHSLTLDSSGRPPVTIDLATPGAEASLKDKPFKIKEGSKFTMSATFKVQHEILSGLHYVQIVKRKGIKVSKDSEMIVCFFFCSRLEAENSKIGEMVANSGMRRAHTLPTPISSLCIPRSVSRHACPTFGLQMSNRMV
jgi:hypothetical protein